MRRLLMTPRGAAAPALAAALLCPRAAAAHPREVVEPGALWASWQGDPWVLVPLALTAVLYLRGVRNLWRRAGQGGGVRRWESACFGGGMLVLITALVTPLHALGGALFSAHMLQHVLLMVVAAPLLVLGRPLLVLLWGLPAGWRKAVGRVAANGGVRSAERWFIHPLVAWSVYAAVLWVWHARPLYEAALHSELVHAVQHGSFLGAALLFWWAAVQLGRRHRTGFGTGVIYVFTTAVHGAGLGALFTFSLVLWYPAYETTAALWGMSALEDQQLGGLVMWVPAGVVYLIGALALLAAWMRAAERAAERNAAHAEQLIDSTEAR